MGSLQRDDGVGVAAQDALDGGGRVEAGGDGAAEGLDAGDGFGGCAGNDNVYGRGQVLGVLCARVSVPFSTRVGTVAAVTHPCQQLDAVALDAVQTARRVQLLHGDGLGGVEAALVDPRLDAVEVDGRHVHLETGPWSAWRARTSTAACQGKAKDIRVVLAPPALRLGDAQRRLPSLEARGHLAVRMLALLAAPCRLALARRRPATAPDLLVVRALVVRQRREDRGASLRLPVAGNPEWRNCWCCHRRPLGRYAQQREGQAHGVQPGGHVGCGGDADALWRPVVVWC